jgi:F-type H+-transporting ATPase subunit b
MLDFTITFIFSLLNIALLFFVLRKLLFKPITKFMDARANSVRNEIEGAEKNRADAIAMRELYEDRMKKADDDALDVVRIAREQAEKQSAATIAEAKRQAESLVANARKQIEAERRQAYLAFKAEAAALVVAATGKLLRRETVSSGNLTMQAEDILREIGKKN